ncbi:MAG: cysteine synthase A [Candidatus ainarchaeum sp.]|nr:cysteine synthase A [Candidatus ainarchaeum sp.]
MICGSVLEAVGGTPLVRLNRLGRETGAEILVKLERANPGGSIKDRPALEMVKEAEKNGKLKPDSVLVEATSGNTGIGLAMVAAAKGCKAVIFMPEDASRERVKLIRAYGAEIRLTPAAQSTGGAMLAAKRFVKATPGALLTDQFENSANPKAHERTGKEIVADTGGRIDAFVAGVGTGGTLQGVATILKKEVPGALIVAVEPDASSLLYSGRLLSDRAELNVLLDNDLAPKLLDGMTLWGKHGIAGIGSNHLASVLDMGLVDRIIKVGERDAFRTARELASREGMLVGISSGANVWAAIEVARGLGRGKRVVTVAPDGGERYLSTPLFPG